MLLSDLSLAWRPKSLSGLPSAMENCLRHLSSTFAPYKSCNRHSPSQQEEQKMCSYLVLFVFGRNFFFQFWIVYHGAIQAAEQPPTTGILWGFAWWRAKQSELQWWCHLVPAPPSWFGCTRGFCCCSIGGGLLQCEKAKTVLLPLTMLVGNLVLTNGTPAVLVIFC